MKDLVEHIRFVHFTLQVIALALVLTSLQSPKPRLQRAYEDAAAIQLLNNNYGEFIDNFQNGIANATKDRPIGQRFYEIRLDGSDSLYGAPTNAILWSGYGIDDTTRLQPPQFRNLADFRTFWERGISAYRLVSFGDHKYCLLDDRSQSLPSRDPTVEVIDADKKKAYASPISWGASSLDINAKVAILEFKKNGKGWMKCEIQLSLEPLGIDSRVVAANAAKRVPWWVPGQFDNSFAELRDASVGLESLAVEDLVKQMQSRLYSDQDRLEIVGAKIPADQILLIGPLLLVACQTYLLLHLKRLRMLIDGLRTIDLPEGYIALYDDRLSRAVAFISGCIIPIISVSMLWRLSSTFMPTFWLTIMQASSIGLSFSIAHVFRAFHLSLGKTRQ
jgi:hypothetical protein